ncbi:MAG TPA: CoA transferase [Acidimicrobiales bacterium]|nr:CoA transferase [Acidimicrobiales bacterium]
MSGDGPLAGLRVLDVGTRISAPFCAGLLGEQGAEVVKIEEPAGGDFMRTIGPYLDEYSLWWAVEGRGRMGATLNLRTPEGQELFRRLAATADVVCENFRPGTMEAWHVGPEDCDPRLVWARISVFGQDGPYSRRPGLDRVGIAYGGLLNITGYPDRPPVRPGVTISDYLTGVFAAQAVIGALYRRDRPDGGTGRGGVVDAPLYGAILRVLEWTIAGQDRIGVTRAREGNRLANSAPVDNFATKDGQYVCIVAGSDANFRRLCRAIGRPELAKDPEWRTLAQRAARGDEINAIVADWAAARTAAEIEAACIAEDVPVGIVYDAAQILADPHFAARGDLVVVDDPVAGPVRQQAPFPRLDGQRPAAPAPAPALGQHNRDVWCGMVGLTEDELEGFMQAGVI